MKLYADVVYNLEFEYPVSCTSDNKAGTEARRHGLELSKPVKKSPKPSDGVSLGLKFNSLKDNCSSKQRLLRLQSQADDQTLSESDTNSLVPLLSYKLTKSNDNQDHFLTYNGYPWNGQFLFVFSYG